MSDKKPQRKPRPVPRTNKRKATTGPTVGADFSRPNELTRNSEELRHEGATLEKNFETILSEAKRNQENISSTTAQLLQMMKDAEQEREVYRKQRLEEEQEIQDLRNRVRDLHEQVRDAELKEMDDLREEVHHLREQLAATKTGRRGSYTHIQARWYGSVPLMWIEKVYWN